MMNYIFIIGTEHQLFQVETAIHHFNINIENAYLIVENTGLDKLFINNIKNTKNFRKVIIFETWTSKDLILNRKYPNSFIKICHQLNKDLYGSDVCLFASHYDTDSTLLIKSILSPKKFYLMDEGTASFETSLERRKKQDNKLKYLMKSILYNKWIELPKQLTYFSKYNLPLTNRDTIEKYKVFKKKNSLSNIDSRQAIFIGSSIVEVNLVEESAYLQLLKKAILLIDASEVYYTPHRKENEDKLSKIEGLGFRIKVINEPFEVYFSNLKEVPAKICSFHTTGVLDNLSIANIVLPELIVMKFDDAFFLKKKDKEIYTIIYEHMLLNNDIKFIEV